MLKIFSFSLILISCIFQTAPGQTLEWHKHYVGSSPRKLILGTDGYLYIAGFSGNDLSILKYNPSGNLIWSKSYNPGGMYCRATDIIFRNNFLYLVGYTADSSRNLTTMKCDSAGNVLWVKFYPCLDNFVTDRAFIKLDLNQNIIVMGEAVTGSNDVDVVIIKYDSNGNNQWSAVINGAAHRSDYAGGLEIDLMGNIYILSTVCKYHTIASFYEFLTAKYNTSGQLTWLQHYGSGVYTYANDIELDDSLNVVITGSNNNNYCTIKYDSNGNQKWVKTYSLSGDYHDNSFSLAIDNNYNIYITGILNNNFPPSKMGTVKYNFAGSQMWDKIYSGSSSVWGKTIKFDNSDGLYIIGSSNYHVLLYKYNTAGDIIFSTTYAYLSEDVPHDLIIDEAKNIYVTGESNPGASNSSLFLIKYSQPNSVDTLSSEIPAKFSLSQNFPNPFNPKTKIRFNLPKNSNVNLIIYNILGKEVSTLVNNTIKAGIYETDFNASNLSSGIYFYKLITEDYSETKKMILIK